MELKGILIHITVLTVSAAEIREGYSVNEHLYQHCVKTFCCHTVHYFRNVSFRNSDQAAAYKKCKENSSSNAICFQIRLLTWSFNGL